MSDDAEQNPTAPTPTPAAPSPQMFARPAAPAQAAPAQDSAAAGGTPPGAAESDADAGATSRFAGTGDPQVDRALAQLPDPSEHHRQAGHDEHADDHADDYADEGPDSVSATGIDLPDPGALDAHLADVTAVHRQLQQRLSDLSG
ncbi:MAG TPA: hypothetical protein VG502_07115 [Flexivirga sp.]|uniref:hypothetical protein n=1 Tax=Flexivirga sp. TaxID=1962927 RepID=UPI002BB4DEB5|nr:hypothetical protein [Flexivirga sp.]HWC22055.1 hypothetical protein [Flexivirga sp.]